MSAVERATEAVLTTPRLNGTGDIARAVFESIDLEEAGRAVFAARQVSDERKALAGKVWDQQKGREWGVREDLLRDLRALKAHLLGEG